MTREAIIRLSANPEGFGESPDELTPDMFASELPTQHSYEYYEDEELGLYIGVWDTDDMIEVAAPYACDEFMWLIEGEAEIRNDKTGISEIARAGEAFIIPKGYDCQWHQIGYLRKFYVIYEHPNEPIPDKPAYEGIVVPKADAPMTVVKDTGAFTLTAGATAQENICYTDTTGKFIAGTWTSQACAGEAQTFPYNGFAYVQDGSIYMEDEAGAVQCFSAGDAFFLPKGTLCSARVEECVTVFFVTVRSA